VRRATHAHAGCRMYPGGLTLLSASLYAGSVWLCPFHVTSIVYLAGREK
jgi:hypothetical protein